MVQPPVLPGSPRSMDRGEPGCTGSPVGLGHYVRKFVKFEIATVIVDCPQILRHQLSSAYQWPRSSMGDQEWH